MSKQISDEQLAEWQALASTGLDTAYAVDAHGEPLECQCDACVLHAVPALIAEVRLLRSIAPYVEASGHYCQGMTEAWTDAQIAIGMQVQAESERDEARAEVRLLREGLAEARGHEYDARNFEEALENVRDALGLQETHWMVIHDQVADVVRERDEALSEVARIREAYENTEAAWFNDRNHLLRQRDEARADAKLLEKLLSATMAFDLERDTVRELEARDATPQQLQDAYASRNAADQQWRSAYRAAIPARWRYEENPDANT